MVLVAHLQSVSLMTQTNIDLPEAFGAFSSSFAWSNGHFPWLGGERVDAAFRDENGYMQKVSRCTMPQDSPPDDRAPAFS